MNQHPVLLTRDVFRESVFGRDGGRCVFCGRPAADAHHILERRLFPDGGYYLANGASVCAEHHLLCEQTVISVEQVREAARVTRPVLPPHLYHDQEYDKWGNPILASGQRLRGELFFDESVQKVLAQGGMLGHFTNRVKFPRTYHLPWSQGITDDDRVMDTVAPFAGRRVIATEKFDGENTTMYTDYLHARSVDGRNHPTRAWVKAFWASICGDIPQDWRVCGENLWAVHSIAYRDLRSFFLGFSIWNERNVALSWDETLQWFELLGVQPVKVLYDGIFDERAIRALYEDKRDRERSEGYVIRLADAFPYSDYRRAVGKFVRANHVQAEGHWLHGRRTWRHNQLATSIA